MNMWEGQMANMTWALEHGRILQTPGLFLFGMLVGRRKYFLYSEQNERLWLKALAISLLCFFPIYGLNNMLPVKKAALNCPIMNRMNNLHKKRRRKSFPLRCWLLS